MKRYFVDTNVLLRFLTGDDARKAYDCLELFRRAQDGLVILYTNEAIVAEVVYVLSSKRLYALSPGDIRARLLPLLTLNGLRLPNRELCLRALELYEHFPDLDYEDALAVAHMEQQELDGIVSYDRDFDAVLHVQRFEPDRIVQDADASAM